MKVMVQKLVLRDSILWVFALMLFAFPTLSNGSQNFEHYEISKLNQGSGFENSQIKCGLQDSNGFIWLGGAEGVTRLNGSSSETFNSTKGLPSNPTRALFIDKKGLIWWGGYDGSPSYFNGRSFKPYLTGNDEFLKNLVVYSFIEVENIIIVTNKGIFELSNHTIKRIFQNVSFDGNKVTSIAFHNKAYYISTTDAIYKSSDRKTAFPIYKGQELNTGGVFTTISNNLYYSCQNILRLDGNQWNSVFKSSSPLPFSNLSLDNEGYIWFAKDNIFKLSSTGVIKVKDTFSSGLAYNFCFWDRENQLWTNDRTLGALTLLKRRVHMEKIGPLYSKYTSISKAKNGSILYLRNDGNVVETDSKGYNQRDLLSKNFIKNSHINHILSLNNNQVLMTSGINLNEVFLLNKYRQVVKIKSIPNSTQGAIVQKKNGEIIIGGNGELFTLKNGKIALHDPLPEIDEPIFDLFLDKKEKLWIIGQSYLYYNLNGKYINLNVLLKDKTLQFNTLAFYGDYIAAGSMGKGIYLFKYSNTGDIKFLQNLTQKDGLVDDVIYRLFIDKNGNCLTQSNFKGFNYIGNIFSSAKRKIISIDKNYLKDINFDKIELLNQDPESGICYLFVDSQLVTFDASILKDYDLIKPKVVLNDIRLFTKTVNWGKRRFQRMSGNVPLNLKLNYQDNFLSFYFLANKFEQSSKIQYYYKLSGDHNKWIGPTYEKSATYNNLTPGDYIFSVKAISANHIYSDVLNYEFTILTPWWLTNWFKIFIVVLISLLAYLIVLYRTRMLRKQNEVLNRLVLERTFDLEESVKENRMLLTLITHDLKGPIYGFSRILNHLNENWEDSSDKIKKDIIQSLDSSIKKLSGFTSQFLSWMMVKKEGSDLKEEVNLNELLLELVEKQNQVNNQNNNKLTFHAEKVHYANVSRQIITLILNNIIENALKYTIDGEVVVSIFRIDNKLHILCKDTGKGMSEDQIQSIYQKQFDYKGDMQQSFKLGWSILVELIENNQMAFEIAKNQEKGTIVTIIIS
jgi:signal transduction histidine kinase